MVAVSARLSIEPLDLRTRSMSRTSAGCSGGQGPRKNSEIDVTHFRRVSKGILSRLSAATGPEFDDLEMSCSLK